MSKELLFTEDFLIDRANSISYEDDIAKRSTTFARYAMADVEFALGVLGTGLSKEEYTKVFRAMMVRKAKNEVRKHNAN